ncbi:MAG: 1,2-phenylacetyl-CoA epoxidase subunit B [Actinomycetota bacterium]|nr:1,2-phenylacetyl-CoA epoxidase subunit B [Actinomycetota bacterium]
MSYEVPLAPGEKLLDLPDRTAASAWPLWEVFIRQRRGLNHIHAGSLHAADAETALQNARDVYTRRVEGVSVWVVRSDDITASDPDDAAELFEPFAEQPYRHATYYQIPDEVGHM